MQFPRGCGRGAAWWPALVLALSACGGGGATMHPDGGAADGDAGLSTLVNPIHVLPGNTTSPIGTINRPFPSLYDAVAAVNANPTWNGNIIVHEGRHELATDLVIPATATLEILPGAKIYMGGGVGLHVQRDVNVHGTTQSPVLFTWLVDGTPWGAFTNVASTSQDNVFDWAIFEHGTAALVGGKDMPGAVSLRGATAHISNCRFRMNAGATALGIVGGGASVIESSDFRLNLHHGLSVGADSDAASTGVIEIRSSFFAANNDDGIHIADGAAVDLHDSFVLGDGGVGVACGSRGVVRITRNVIAGCLTGISITDMAAPTIVNNTLYGNGVGVAVYESAAGKGIGRGSFSNGIIWGSIAADVAIANVAAAGAQTTFAYSCIKSGSSVSDVAGTGTPKPLTGTGLTSMASGCKDPLFAAPATLQAPTAMTGASIDPGDLHLQSTAGRFDPNSMAFVATDTMTSPCIDTGDPATSFEMEPAPNGARVNMGAYGGTAQASKSP
jgi:parallel beta-helix repeat protein